MFPATSMVAFGGHRTLFYNPPRGTCSRIISLRLHRHSRATVANFSSYRRLYASAPLTDSIDAISNQEFGFFRDLLTPIGSKPRPKNNYSNVVSARIGVGMTAPPIKKPFTDGSVNNLPRPFQRVIVAMQHRDTRRLIISLRQILNMGELELQNAIAALPRTTFTELLYSLDPLKIAKEVDPTNGVNITTGMYQVLDMGSYVDDWGVRKLWVELLRCMMALVVGLKASGQALQTEEYTFLFRCAGAASDLAGVKWLWNDMILSDTTYWRETETYNEFMAARFLTRPLYNSFDKVRKVVIPRDLHRSRIKLDQRYVGKLDRLRLNTRIKRLYFGLNKDVDHAEDLKRLMRKNRSATKIFNRMLSNGYVKEYILYIAIVAFGRAGSLRFIGSEILHRFFGIKMGRLVYEEGRLAPSNDIRSVPSRVRPSARLMAAIVDAYGSNGEIGLAFQLVDHISKKQNIKIPRATWHDLLEWAYVLSTPSVSTMWVRADMRFKVPDPSAVELIFGAMQEYGLPPQFEDYSIVIRNLIGRRQFSKILPLMKHAVRFYNDQCLEYAEAVFEYAQLVRAAVSVSEAVDRYERARFTKAKMWYDLQISCKQFLSRVRSHSIDNPLTTKMVPEFIREFQTFIPNPALYRTSTGYVSLFDPGRDKPRTASVRDIPMDVPMKHRGNWVLQRVKARKTDIVHSHSLGGHLPMAKLGLVTLLTSTSRRGLPPTDHHVSEHEPKNPYSEDDDDFF
ncbi:hypothetical protein F4781DRAFT_176426 [Annulohypoxylon bovei var. microspora]|nr:hypothetical protein F4781DRAFT_176426 [Annulohypoxylon bovei var. microspora]